MRKKENKTIAKQRIKYLLKFSLEKKDERPFRDYIKNYIYLVWKLKTRYKVKLDKKEKILFCRKCKTLLIPGRTAIVRINKIKKNKRKKIRIKIICKECGYKRSYLWDLNEENKNKN